MLQQWITHCLETETQKTQKSKNYKKTKQLETIELKNTITEIKKKTQITLTKWSQYGDAKDSISKCEYRAIEFSQFKWQKLNKLLRHEQSLRNLCYNNERFNMCTIRVLERE